MSGWTVEVMGPESRLLEHYPLPLATGRCRLRLRSLPGSSGLQLPCAVDGATRWRFEVPAAAEEIVTVDFELDAEGELHAWSENRSVFVLPPDERFAPPSPARLAASAPSLELLWVIDGTARAAGGGDHPWLLGSKDWPAVVDRLVDLAAALGAGKAARLGLVAFGDEPFPMLDAPDLQPAYRLWPLGAERGELPRFPLAELKARLSAVPPTSGGDFVDALADALAFCADLPTEEKSRRIVLVVGDSPGHSLTEPAPDGADLLPRAQEIEGPLRKLHTLGALVATIFHDPGIANDPNWAHRRDLPEHARRQYAAFASTPALAFELADLDPHRAAKAILRVPEMLGFGCCYGVVVEVVGS